MSISFSQARMAAACEGALLVPGTPSFSCSMKSKLPDSGSLLSLDGSLQRLRLITTKDITATEKSFLQRISKGQPYRVTINGGSEFSAHFQVGGRLKKGAHSSVHRCRGRADHTIYAVKTMSKRLLFELSSDGDTVLGRMRDLREEIAVMKMLNGHPNVAALCHVFEDDRYVRLVLEYCHGGELFEHISQSALTENQVAAFTRQLLSLLTHMHDECGIVHCDLKPSNIMFADKRRTALKLIDFGFSKVLSKGRHLNGKCGTAHYMAPEAIATTLPPSADGKCVRKVPHYAHACDLWSVGAVVFTALFRCPPFAVDPTKYEDDKYAMEQAIYSKVLAKGFRNRVVSVQRYGYGPWFPRHIPVSAECRDFVARLLQSDACRRMSAAQSLAHPWISQFTVGAQTTLAVKHTGTIIDGKLESTKISKSRSC